VNDDINNALYRRYRELADGEPDVIFGGRLGMYQYYDMDKAVAAALEAAGRELGL
jgi:UDP-galactopyranose mutase